MRVFVTGGTGFLGSHIVARLQDAGHEVRALVRTTSDTAFLRERGVQLVAGSMEDAESLRGAVQGVDAVVHGAGLIKARSEAAFDRVNHGGTVRLLEAVLAACPDPKRFALVSSIASGGPRGKTGPVSAYGRSKRRGEDAVVAVADRLRVSVIRPPVIYGPRDRETLPLFQAGRLGLFPVLGAPDSVFSMIYAEDCADAVVRMVESDGPSGAIYPVDDGVAHTYRDLSDATAAALGKRRLFWIRTPDTILGLAAWVSENVGRLRGQAVMFNRDKLTEIRQKDWSVGHVEITRDLGWRPRCTLPDGLVRSLAWYRQAGWL